MRFQETVRSIYKLIFEIFRNYSPGLIVTIFVQLTMENFKTVKKIYVGLFIEMLTFVLYIYFSYQGQLWVQTFVCGMGFKFFVLAQYVINDPLNTCINLCLI